MCVCVCVCERECVGALGFVSESLDDKGPGGFEDGLITKTIFPSRQYDSFLFH